MDKILEAVILLPESVYFKRRVIRRIVDTCSQRPLTHSDILAIFETCQNITFTSKVDKADIMAIYVYKIYGKQYKEELKEFLSYHRLCSLMIRRTPRLNISFIWMKEGIKILKDDEEVIQKLKKALERIMTYNFWDSVNNILWLCYVADIYCICPCLIPEGELKNTYQTKLIHRLSGVGSFYNDNMHVTSKALPPFIDLLWSNSKMKDYDLAAFDLVDRISDRKAGCSSAVYLVMNIIPRCSVLKALDKYCSDKGEESYSNLEYGLEAMIKWILNGRSINHLVIAAWIRIFVFYLYTIGKGLICSEKTKKRLPLIMTNLPIPSLTNGLIEVFEVFMLTFRRSPVVLDVATPRLIEIIKYSIKEQKSNAKGHMPESILKRLIFIIHTMLHYFQMSKTYPRLKDAMSDYPKPAIKDMEATLKAFAWEDEASVTLELYQSKENSAKPITGYRQFITQAVANDIAETLKECKIDSGDPIAQLDIHHLCSEESNGSYRNISFDTQVMDALEDTYKKINNTQQTCCHPNHSINTALYGERNVRKKFTEDYFGKVFLWL